ncbi:MAG TPA: GTP-binding protein, partial [Candidatus Polarisedimenticolaceae bacterium]|nr:GTP-binding protein [Candidatus Polarisedimenticolaceae bacterium]
SDFVIINKTDLATAAKIKQISELVRGANPRARIFKAAHGEIDVNLLLGQDLQRLPESATPGDHSKHAHLHEKYTTLSFHTDKPLEPQAFQNFVNRLIPTSVYRAKGVVDLGKKGHRRKYIFQLVGKRAELTWDDWENDQPATELVFIGQDFDADALNQLLENCIDAKPEVHDPSQEVMLPKRQR